VTDVNRCNLFHNTGETEEADMPAVTGLTDVKCGKVGKVFFRKQFLVSQLFTKSMERCVVQSFIVFKDAN